MVEWGGLENRCTFAGTEGSNPSPSATLRSSSFGWLAPVSRTKLVELGVSSEALAKEDWFEPSPVNSAISIKQQRFRSADLIRQPNRRVWQASCSALSSPNERSCTANALPSHRERPPPTFTNC